MIYQRSHSLNPFQINLTIEASSHWKKRRLSRICKDIGSGTTPSRENNLNFIDGTIPWVLTGELNNSVLLKGNFYITEYALDHYPSLKIYPANSIIIAMYGSTIGKVSILKFASTVNQACCVLPPSEGFDSTFLFYSLIAAKERLLSLAVGGAQSNIKVDTIKSIEIALPSITEQKKISSYLDKEIGLIKSLIIKREKLIKLLKDKKQALIRESISRGMNKTIQLKSSGINYLGKVPVHWSVKRLSHLFKTLKGKSSQQLTKTFCQKNKGPYPVYSGQTDGNGIMASINVFEFDTGKQRVILSTTVGAKAMTVKNIHGRFNLSQNCMIIFPKSDECLTSYFEYCFSSIFQLERALIPSYIKPSFRKEDFLKIKIPVPPIKEQENIARFLKKEVGQIDELIELSEVFILKLREKQNTLIILATKGGIPI